MHIFVACNNINTHAMPDLMKSMFLGLGLLMAFDASSQEVEKLTFFEKYRQGESPATVSILPKEQRLSCRNKGNIGLEWSGDIPDSVRICAEVAADIWRSCIETENAVRLECHYEDLDSDNDVEIEVFYKQNEGIYYPTSLYRHLWGELGETTKPDAEIHINKKMEWDCSHNETVVPSARSMTYAMMRAIAISLGFGSSVTRNTIGGNDIIVFGGNSGCSIFDSFIFSSDGQYLKAIDNIGNSDNPTLTSFAQPESGTFIYALTQDEKHRLYAPTLFETYKSLIYLDDEESLMHFDLKTGTKRFRVDEVTKELLHAIGWSFKASKDIEIVGEGINENGITSAYEGHTFSLRNNVGGTITDVSWTYTLPLANGGDTIVSMSENTLVFSIGSISDESKYKINVNGDIYGKVSFTGSINGKVVQDTYNLSLELKPRINNVNIILKKESHLIDYYDISFVVEYTGTNMVTVSVEEEYSSKLRSQSIYEPFLAHVYIPSITSFNHAWIDIEAENKYGKDIYTVELPPFEGNGVKDVMQSNRCAGSPEDYTGMEVFHVSDNRISRIQDLGNLQSLHDGLYIIKYYKGKDCIKTTKYMKR